jgi:hypothetical protein
LLLKWSRVETGRRKVADCFSSMAVFIDALRNFENGMQNESPGKI